MCISRDFSVSRCTLLIIALYHDFCYSVFVYDEVTDRGAWREGVGGYRKD